jgi:hypothetical protein
MKTITISKMKTIQKQKDRYWFDGNEFFNTIIETPSKKNFFVTSERMEIDFPKKYSIRYFNENTGFIETVGDFQDFDELENAKINMNILIKMFDRIKKENGFLENSIIENLHSIDAYDYQRYKVNATVENNQKFLYIDIIKETVSF